MDAREEACDSDPATPGVGGPGDMLLGVRSDGLLAPAAGAAHGDGRRIVRAPSRMRVAHDPVQPMGISVLEVDLDIELLPEGSPEAALELGAIGEDEYWDLVETGFEDW